MRVKIFVSYSNINRSIVKTIDEFLLEEGFDVWIDYRNLDLSTCLHPQLRKGIMDCDIFFLVKSDASMSSKWVGFEKQQANEFEKKIITYDITDSIFVTTQRIRLLFSKSRY